MSDTTHTPHAALADFPHDPRVVALASALTDAQAEHVLRQMNAAWSPEEDTDMLLSTPDRNRGLIEATFVMNLAMATGAGSTVEREFATLVAFVAEAEAACSPVSHPEPPAVISMSLPSVEGNVAYLDAIAAALGWPVRDRQTAWPVVVLDLPEAHLDDDQATLAAMVGELALAAGVPDLAKLHVLKGLEPGSTSVPTVSELWHYALEEASGPDGLADAASTLRRIGSPVALRFAARLRSGDDMARTELQLTRWCQARMTSYGLMSTAEVSGLAELHELAGDLPADEARRLLSETPKTDRLPYWA